MLTKNILYAIKLLTEKKMLLGKTFIQKVLYLSLPKESRESYYVPYFFGPYSENVQLLLKSLEFSGYINYDPSLHRYELLKSYDRFEEDDITQRINIALDFLIQHNITSTQKISKLAKTFMILDANNMLNNGHKTDDAVKLIKERADSVGWNELSKERNDIIKEYFQKSKKLAKTMPT